MLLPQTTTFSILQIKNLRKQTDNSKVARPFLKWVGGKRSILPELLNRMPRKYNSYHEPFVGGGALFFAIQPKEAFISDINTHLTTTYQIVRDNVDELIQHLELHKREHCKDYFLEARKNLSTESDPVKIAGLFIYLNKTCFNGLYRVNKSGAFNVSMGAYKSPKILDIENLRKVSSALQGVGISTHGYEYTKIRMNDFYYLDHPYHKTYSGYDGSGFIEKNHIELASFCKTIDESGGFFMLSNSDTPFVRDLYREYFIDLVSASSLVSCNARQRGKREELIIRNYE